MDKPLNILETIDCMVVDDSVAIRKIVRQLLEQMGVVRIREAEDSIEALERLKNSRSDVAIVDYELGTFTGVDFIRMLRTARGSPAENIGLILLTAHNDPTLEQKAREAGADDYLTKPVSREKLKASLINVLEQRADRQKSDNSDPGSTIYI